MLALAADQVWYRASAVVSFRVSAGERATETRVLLTGQRSRRAFRRSWLLIRPFGGLVRRQRLVAVVRWASQA